MDLFPYLGEMSETPTLLEPLERADLNHRSNVFISDLRLDISMASDVRRVDSVP
jgi:hypothetical protein